MIYIIKTVIGKRIETQRFFNKGDAVAFYRLRLSELAFPDSIDVGLLNDGEDNGQS